MPGGTTWSPELQEISITETAVSCAVKKDGGDDPDITTGALIFATVSRRDLPGIVVDGGEGVGRVTLPGLDQPVGEAAINSVPRKMIREHVDLTRVAFFTAAYRHYLKYKVDDHGMSFEINEPWLTATDYRLIASNDALDFLSLSPFAGTDLRASEDFVEIYQSMVRRIREEGTLPVLESILS